MLRKVTTEEKSQLRHATVSLPLICPSQAWRFIMPLGATDHATNFWGFVPFLAARSLITATNHGFRHSRRGLQDVVNHLSFSIRRDFHKEKSLPAATTHPPPPPPTHPTSLPSCSLLPNVICNYHSLGKLAQIRSCFLIKVTFQQWRGYTCGCANMLISHANVLNDKWPVALHQHLASPREIFTSTWGSGPQRRVGGHYMNVNDWLFTSTLIVSRYVSPHLTTCRFPH